MKPISEQEVAKFRTFHLKDWSFEKDTIKRDPKFKTFVDAFSFMTAVVLETEKMDHHPDCSNGYNKISIAMKSI